MAQPTEEHGEVASPPGQRGQESGRPRAALRAGAIGAVAAGIITVAYEAPSVSMFFNSPFAALHAGKAMPATFLISSIIILLVALNISAFAKKLPTSGFAYTFVSSAFSTRWGFVAAWMAVFTFAVTPMINIPYFGVTISDLIYNLGGPRISWTVGAVFLIAVVAYLGVAGISQSAKVGAIFLTFEVCVLTVFAVYMVAKGGAHGQVPSTLSPTAAPSIGAFAVGMIFAVLSFQGFESAATLGEETKQARRYIPLALISAVAATAVFYTFVTYAATIGWGANRMQSYATASGTPFTQLATTYAGSWLADLLDAVVAAGIFAVVIASVSAAARVLFALGREGLLPRVLGRAHSTRQTPWAATLLVSAGAGGIGTIYGVLWNPTQVWGFLGSSQAISALVVYIFVSLGVINFYWRRHRSEFAWFRHGVIPIVATVAMIVPLVIRGGLVWPAPAYPFNLPPYIVLAWLIIAVVIVAAISRRDPSKLERAGKLMSE
jgi:amino acid transporter